MSASLALAAQTHSFASDWDKIVEAAKKEGKVVASIPPTPELRKLMEIAFTRRYGIATEFVPARGGAVIQRIVSEAKAGVQYFDLHIGGTESVVTGLLAGKYSRCHRSLSDSARSARSEILVGRPYLHR